MPVQKLRARAKRYQAELKELDARVRREIDKTKARVKAALDFAKVEFKNVAEAERAKRRAKRSAES